MRFPKVGTRWTSRFRRKFRKKIGVL